MLVCDKCRAAYHAARADDLLLTRALLDALSGVASGGIATDARVPRTSWSQRIATVNEVVIWGILAVAASQILLGESSTAAHCRRLLGRRRSGSAGSESGEALAGASSPTAVGVVSASGGSSLLHEPFDFVLEYVWS